MNVAAIKASELEGYQRIDAEYYQPYCLEIGRRFEHFKSLGEYKAIIFHPAEVKRVYEEEGLQLVLAQNVRANRLDLSKAGFLPLEVEPEIRRNRLEPGDVVISRSGTVGEVAPYDGSPAPLYASADCLVIRCKDIPSAYLSTYLNTDIGRALVKRGTYGAVQTHVAPDYLRTLRIPRDAKTEKVVEQKLKEAKERFRESERLYAQAQAMLAAELGLDKLDLPTEDISTRRLSAVAAASRIDAEYYHSQKAYVQDWLDKLPGKAISTYFKSVREIYNPPQADTGKSILNFDLTDALRYFVDETGPMIPENEIGSIKKRLRNGDVIVSRLRSYLKEIALVEVPKGVECVGSSEFIVLRPLSIEVYPEALAVYLRSDPVQTILKWSQDGSNHPRFQEDELLAIKLPDRVIKVQGEIRKLIRSGIQAYRTANDLLAEAKAEVERLIEQA